MAQHRNPRLTAYLLQWPILPACLALAGCGTINFTPASLTLSAGSSAQVTASASGNSAPLTATVSPGQTVIAVGAQTPGASDTLTIPVQGSASETVKAVTAGQTTVLATAPGTGNTYQWSGSFNVTVNPVLSSIAPANGQTGSTVTLTGIGFTSGAAVIYTPSGGSALPPVTPNPGGTSSTLQAALPMTAGNYSVHVQTSEASAGNGPANTQVSQDLPYTVTSPPSDQRIVGAFTEFDSGINLSPSQTCSTRAVKLATVQVHGNAYQATYTNASTGAQIHAPIPFSIANGGIANSGAGFSACNVGIVWNALGSGDAQEYLLLNLSTGAWLQANDYKFAVTGGTMQNPLTYIPQLWNSPDASIILIATADPTKQAVDVGFIDVNHNGKNFATATLAMTEASPPTFTASVAPGGLSIILTPTGATCAVGTATPKSSCTIDIP